MTRSQLSPHIHQRRYVRQIYFHRRLIILSHTHRIQTHTHIINPKPPHTLTNAGTCAGVISSALSSYPHAHTPYPNSDAQDKTTTPTTTHSPASARALGLFPVPPHNTLARHAALHPPPPYPLHRLHHPPLLQPLQLSVPLLHPFLFFSLYLHHHHGPPSQFPRNHFRRGLLCVCEKRPMYIRRDQDKRDKSTSKETCLQQKRPTETNWSTKTAQAVCRKRAIYIRRPKKRPKVYRFWFMSVFHRFVMAQRVRQKTRSHFRRGLLCVCVKRGLHTFKETCWQQRRPSEIDRSMWKGAYIHQERHRYIKRDLFTTKEYILRQTDRLSQLRQYAKSGLCTSEETYVQERYKSIKRDLFATKQAHWDRLTDSHSSGPCKGLATVWKETCKNQKRHPKRDTSKHHYELR